MVLKRLSKEKGFPVDLRPAVRDEIAYHFAVKWFGQGQMDRIAEKYKRASVSLEELTKDVKEYDVVYVPRVKDPVYTAVLESVRRDFVPKKHLIPWTLGKVEKDGIPKDKSPGLPWKERGYRTKAEVLADPVAMGEIHGKWAMIGKGYHTSLPDSLCYFRAQICSPDTNKVRATWGYPLELTLEEGRFVYPYLEWIRHAKHDVPVGYGVEMATGGMGFIDLAFQECGPNTKVAMLDWRRFDKHVPAWLVRDAFSVMAQAFDFSRVECSDAKVWLVDPLKSERRWKKCVNYFIETPIRLPTGERFVKSGGVPSGSTFTNIIDTIINAIVTRYVIYHVTGAGPKYDVYMGDDSVIMLDGGLDLEKFASVSLEVFGFHLNTRKSYITGRRTNISFLGYFNYQGKPVRDGDFLLASFIYPERFHGVSDPMFTTMRAVGQMWSTLNGVSANRWLDMIEDMETSFGFDKDWFDTFMKEHPASLKWLRLTGLEPTKLHIPRKAGNPFLSVIDSLVQPRRYPIPRTFNVEKLYQDYYNNFLDDATVWEQFVDARVECGWNDG
nr:MAG: RNA-dependent RNA polymerase [XiangYun partiti-picobirna-like virus 9]